MYLLVRQTPLKNSQLLPIGEIMKTVTKKLPATKAPAKQAKAPRQRKALGKASFNGNGNDKQSASSLLAFTGKRYTSRATQNARMAGLFETALTKHGITPYELNAGIYFTRGELEAFCTEVAHKSWVSYMVGSKVLAELNAAPSGWQAAPLNNTTGIAARIAEAEAIIAAAKPAPKAKRKAPAKPAPKKAPRKARATKRTKGKGNVGLLA